MNGMERLANLAESITKDLDARANAAADRLAAGKQKVLGAIDQYEGFASGMEKSADNALAALGQTSNMPPPSPSSPEPKPAPSPALEALAQAAGAAAAPADGTVTTTAQ